MEEHEFLTARGAAKWLRVHLNTIYSMVRRGRLKGYSIRRCLCFKRMDIEQLLGGHRTGDPWVGVSENEFLTVREAADLLLMHTSVIHRMVKEGRLKAYLIGERMRFRGEDVHTLLGR